MASFRGETTGRDRRIAVGETTHSASFAATAYDDDRRAAPGVADDDREVPWLEESPLALGERSEGARKPPRRGPSAKSSGRATRETGLLSEEELRSLEREHDSGITAVEVVELFTQRGIRLSEATFRKYVQQGLLPRSRRIGRKGKHRGSMGVYPAKTVRRVNTIKQLMLDGYTIDEIQEHFLRFADLVENIEEALSELFDSLEEVIEGPRFDDRVKKSLGRELTDAKRLADDLLKRIGGLAETAAEPPTDRYRSSGAAGSAEELL